MQLAHNSSSLVLLLLIIVHSEVPCLCCHHGHNHLGFCEPLVCLGDQIQVISYQVLHFWLVLTSSVSTSDEKGVQALVFLAISLILFK